MPPSAARPPAILAPSTEPCATSTSAPGPRADCAKHGVGMSWLAVLLVTMAAEVPSPSVTGAAPGTTPRLRASRTAGAPALDGRLDDPVWQSAEVAQAFTQKFPSEAAPPSETTRFRVLYDDHA